MRNARLIRLFSVAIFHIVGARDFQFIKVSVFVDLRYTLVSIFSSSVFVMRTSEKGI